MEESFVWADLCTGAAHLVPALCTFLCMSVMEPVLSVFQAEPRCAAAVTTETTSPPQPDFFIDIPGIFDFAPVSTTL